MNSPTKKRRLWSILAVVLVAALVLLATSQLSRHREDAANPARNAFIETQTDEQEVAPRTKKDGFLKWILKRKRGKKWPSSQGFPCISPADFVNLEGAIYSSSPRRFLFKMTKGRYKIVSTLKFRKWKAFAVTGPRRRLFFVFRGANKIKTQLRTIVGFINVDKKRLNKWVAKRTKKYAKRGYTVYAYIGLSAGGHFANTLKAKKNVWRLSLNGYKCKGGRNKINLRSTDDWLTSKKDKNYLTVPFTKGGHRIKAFKKMRPLTRVGDWKKVHKVFKQWKRCRGP